MDLHRIFSKTSTKDKETSRRETKHELKRHESEHAFRVLEEKKVINFPDDETLKRSGIKYALIRPFAYANIKWKDDQFTYVIEEPELNGKEKVILARLIDGLVQTINVSPRSLSKKGEVITFLEERTKGLMADYGIILKPAEFLNVMYYIYRDFVGLNEIEPLMQDPYIEDISCDGTGTPVYIIHQRLGSIPTSIQYNDLEKLKNFVIKLAEKTDRYVSYAAPLMDGTLGDGSRVQISLASDVTTKGPTFSIRKFRSAPFTPVDMMHLNTASADILSYLWFAVQNGANILIAGAVSTGKTSFLNTLSLFIPSESKIVSIEDTREINLPHDNWIPSVSRSGFSGSVGEVSLFDLLKESFRQNPEYLIVGEVRGAEASVMFQAMASGHIAFSTMHAGSVNDVIKRLETPPINLSPGLLDTLDIIIVMVHAQEKGKSARRVKEIMEIKNVDWESGEARTNQMSGWDAATDTFTISPFNSSALLEKIAKRKGLAMDHIIQDLADRKKVLFWLSGKDFGWKEVSDYLSLYEKDKEKMMSLIN